MHTTISDYRSTKLSKFDDIISRKKELEETLKKQNPRTQIMYNRVKDKKKDFMKFAEVYNRKCAYCGVSIYIIDIHLFEVDHFICESSFPTTTEGRAEAGEISNLVLACHTCNRGKSDFLIKKSHQDILNPDNSSISRVFFRDENYYIKIHQKYITDPVVRDFYEKLVLGSEFRRLDYLLMEMRDLLSQHNSELLEKSYRFLSEARKSCLQ